MTTLTVRNLDPEVQRLLKVKAAANNRSMEAEVRAILGEAVRIDTFARDWIEITKPLRGDFELPERSMPREIDLG